MKTKQEIEQMLEYLENDYKNFSKDYRYGDDVNMSLQFFREIMAQKQKVIETIKLVLSDKSENEG